MTHIVDPTLRPIHAKIYAAIMEAWTDYGYAPSHVEIRDACFPCSLTTVQQAIRELKRRGYITAPKFQQRGAKPTDMERTISREPLDPWRELEPPVKFFKRTESR
ncbi:MAG: hypothetical protein WC829_04425 [Hyphomicrobium sp.]|jgi:SOS-response transcriptional repressor LexA